MITSPRPNLYVSDEGFSVEVLGRSGLCYRKDQKEMFIDSEVLAGLAGVMVYKSSIEQWEPPHATDLIDERQRERILNNIREVFRAQGFEIDIV